MASQPDPVTHELRGDLRYDDELFDKMVEEWAQWEAQEAYLRGEAPTMPERRRPFVCTCGHTFEYDTKFERHLARMAMEARLKRDLAWASRQRLAEDAAHGDVEAEIELDLRDEYDREEYRDE